MRPIPAGAHAARQPFAFRQSGSIFELENPHPVNPVSRVRDRRADVDAPGLPRPSHWMRSWRTSAPVRSLSPHSLATFRNSSAKLALCRIDSHRTACASSSGGNESGSTPRNGTGQRDFESRQISVGGTDCRQPNPNGGSSQRLCVPSSARLKLQGSAPGATFGVRRRLRKRRPPRGSATSLRRRRRPPTLALPASYRWH